MTLMQKADRFLPGFLSVAAARIQELSERRKAWDKEKAVRAELRRYTDRELADIGLSRSQIETMDLSENA